MRDYQKPFYRHYYTMTPDGVETEVSRHECFAPAEDPTPDCPYLRRWWYDLEASYAIRLPRGPLGEALGKRNAADRKKQERVDFNAVKYTGIELDKSIGYGDDGATVYTELEDETADMNAIYEDQSKLDILMDVLNTLSEDDRALWDLMKAKVRKQEIADRFHITLDGVRYRENRLKCIIRSYPILKEILNDD
ncbi:MAG TPA: hypothetical protein PKC96_07220 [Bacilli bacterium]|nr:hypothetical protein [Bacilli bacterium]